MVKDYFCHYIRGGLIKMSRIFQNVILQLKDLYNRRMGVIDSSGSLTICGTSDTPEAILAEAVDATSEDKQAVVYLTGEFNSAALTVASGASADGLKAKLRAKNIFIKTNQAY